MTNSGMDRAQAARLRDCLLGPLHTLFLAAGQAYGDYMANGKSFLFACNLRETNMAVKKLLIEHGHLLPEGLQPHVAALLRHYDVWLKLWEELAAAEKPTPEQPFVFENSVRFPREAQQALVELYEQLRS